MEIVVQAILLLEIQYSTEFGVKMTTKYISLTEQLLKEQNNNRKLRRNIDKTIADIDYIAMMCDVDLDMDSYEQTEEENN